MLVEMTALRRFRRQDGQALVWVDPGENIMVERDQVKFYETTGRAKSKPAKYKKGD